MFTFVTFVLKLIFSLTSGLQKLSSLVIKAIRNAFPEIKGKNRN